MKTGNRVLFWFRNHLSIHGNPALHNALGVCSELIPVFCFDPREIAVYPDSDKHELAANQLINKISVLRNQLQNKGSNLLIVNNHYERIIPSLARVLSVNEVISDPLLTGNETKLYHSIQFRNQKAQEVKSLLNMHSIPFNHYNQQHPLERMHSLFPGFPEINSGQLPSVHQFLGHESNSLRSVAC